MPPLSNQRHEIFAQRCAEGRHNTDAYELAGYKRHDGNASSLRGKKRVSDRIAEIQHQINQKTQIFVVKQAAMTRQYLLDALWENIEKSLARMPVLVGPGVEGYAYRGEVANNAIKMAGSECGLFQERAEITHRMDFSDLSDEALLIRLRDETEQLLLERKAAGLDGAGDDPEPST
jgi:hypothetical protein